MPEVQTIVNDLNRKAKGRRIVRIRMDWPKMIKYPPADKRSFINLVRGRKILRVERRSKYIKFYLSGDLLMVFHLKMTGHFLLTKKLNVKSQKFSKHIRAVFYFDDGRALFFSDRRKFGTMRVGKIGEVENLPDLKNLGPEPLENYGNFEKFSANVDGSKRKIKQVLMDPKIVAGIGNIYSDEALWLAKIHPLAEAGNLTKIQLKKLWQALQTVLKKSLKLRGTSARDYRDTEGRKGGYYEKRLVYHREGEPCLRCGAKIKRVRIGGRSAHFCPNCQVLK